MGAGGCAQCNFLFFYAVSDTGPAGAAWRAVALTVQARRARRPKAEGVARHCRASLNVSRLWWRLHPNLSAIVRERLRLRCAVLLA